MARHGQKFDRAEGSMCKLVAGDTAVPVTEQAIRILGGNGPRATTSGPIARPVVSDDQLMRGSADVRELVAYMLICWQV